MILYRPIGHKELELLIKAGLREFPPRLPDQPIFYPVLNVGYAREIAEGWNTKSDTYAGYITRFNLKNDYFEKFEKQIVGGMRHEEIWVPATQLDEFNSNIIGHIEIIAAYFGDKFIGSLPSRGFQETPVTAHEYLQKILATFEYNTMDFRAAIVMNYLSVFCNYAFWKQLDLVELDSSDQGKAQQLLPAICEAWHTNFPGVRLPTESELTEAEIATTA